MSVIGIAGSELSEGLKRVQREVDSTFDAFLPVPNDTRARLVEAMRYAAIGGGKRVRPFLVVSTAELYGVDRTAALRAGTAIEAIHVYSLIHDDLPCMDDDDLRHGKATVHKVYDDATAVLAGDALHALAFEILADPGTSSDPFVRSELIATLGKASGMDGMAVACVNPAAPGSTEATPLEAYLSNLSEAYGQQADEDVAMIDERFMKLPGFLTAQCLDQDGAQ